MNVLPSPRRARLAHLAMAAAACVLLHGCGGGDGGSTSTQAGPGPAPVTPAPDGGGRPDVATLAVHDITPQSGVPGTSVTISGEGFTRSTSLSWGDKPLDGVFQSATQITFVLPSTHAAADTSRALTLRREDGAEASGAQPLTIEAVPEPVALSIASASVGQLVRVRGANLQLATRIAIGDQSVAASATAADGTWLDFVVPAQAASGSVVVIDAKDRRFAVAPLEVGGTGLAVKISDVQVAQAQLHSVSGAVPSRYLRLVPGKPLLVRVRLEPGDGAQTIEPEVRLTVRNDALGTRTVAMKGPQKLGAQAVAEDDLAGSYTYELPGEWVQRGLKLDVEANEKRFPGVTARFAYEPPAGVLGVGTYIRLHLVPIQPDSGETVDLDLDTFQRNVRGLYPLSEVEFIVEPPLKQPGTRLNDSEAWLGAVGALRKASAPTGSDFYFGVLPCDGCTGLGWTPGRTAVASHRWYGRKDYATGGVMMHELGHNFGREHSFEDAAFPYHTISANRLGGPWVINLLRDRVLYDPAEQYDVMSYSYPKTVSDYTYSGAYAYLEKAAPLSQKPAARETRSADAKDAAAKSADALYIAGSIGKDGVAATLSPLLRMPIVPDTVALAPQAVVQQGDLVVEIDAAGGRFRYPVHPVGLSHGEGAAALAFELAVPPIEAIRSIRVLRDGSPLLTRDATQGAPRPLMAARPGPGATSTDWGSYLLRDGKLTLTWDARRWPWLSVWQDGEGGLKPLAVSRTGGSLEEALRGQSVRGLVIGLSDGLNGRLERITP
ncbi:IPT/TIG domain-containing protein [Cupriavidus sp. USMAHM13]|uniref:IPT/TIG domain-containing protein n=1 Tax=Cupriavidus sp. USMAHM13 TaxID=1389192 RepID=UPI0009F2F98B|nr:IPT/TIG domain-containing protein [Cupriavidus sp. USMAHM13]